eukprot:m.133524 g.133524  ORF g.133524 m.133524 type:complete len:82 (-) comp9504_c0_seq1:1779-2024(-)
MDLWDGWLATACFLLAGVCAALAWLWRRARRGMRTQYVKADMKKDPALARARLMQQLDLHAAYRKHERAQGTALQFVAIQE